MSLVSGLLFGAGLALGGMTDPGKVVAFLDVTGAWDPSLAFVMGSALLVTFPVFAWVRRSARPLFAERFQLPTRRDLDPQLQVGAALFGIGWGIAGLCPGPAIANLAAGSPEILLFVVAMVAGMWLRDRTAAITG
ncbi:MAG: YeeE/YedE family protein [Nevskia sp.]|nr:YeeE/YedE family protein [Nevskia sp.]